MSLDGATPLPGRTDHRMINSVTMAGTIIMVIIQGTPTTLSDHNEISCIVANRLREVVCDGGDTIIVVYRLYCQEEGEGL